MLFNKPGPVNTENVQMGFHMGIADIFRWLLRYSTARGSSSGSFLGAPIKACKSILKVENTAHLLYLHNKYPINGIAQFAKVEWSDAWNGLMQSEGFMKINFQNATKKKFSKFPFSGTKKFMVGG